MTNEDIMKDVYAYLDANGVPRDAEDFSWYGPFCQVVSAYVHGKLSVTEIVGAADKLNDLLTSGIPQFHAFPLQKKERISGQIRAMEWLPMTKGKLTDEEKEKFAFCVWYYTCVRVEDEKTHRIVPPVSDFQSKAKIDALYEDCKHGGLHDEMFDGDKHPEPTGRYGYEITNPVMCVSIQDEYSYLRRLVPVRGEIVKANRIGSMVSDFGICDAWSIEIKGGIFGLVKKMKIYICPYGRSNSITAPDGFRLRM